jgi:hypothetical protein
MPIILATLLRSQRSGVRNQESEIRSQRSAGSKPAGANSLQDPISKKTLHRKKKKKELVEWLKVKVLSSSLSTTHTKKNIDGEVGE